MHTEHLSGLMNDFKLKFSEFAENWWEPEKFNEKPSKFIRLSLVAQSIVAAINGLVKIVFSLLSFIPRTDSEWFTEKIGGNVKGLAEKGLVHDIKTNQILPALFKAVALTINPYALRKDSTSFQNFSHEDIESINCKSYALFQMAQKYSKEGKPVEETEEMNGFEETTVPMEDVTNCEQNVFPNQEAPKDVENISKEKTWKAWVVSEIGARAFYLAATLAITVEKIGYLAAGVFLAIAAFCLGFSDVGINMYAMKYLQALDVIEDICIGLRATFSPRELMLHQFNPA